MVSPKRARIQNLIVTRCNFHRPNTQLEQFKNPIGVHWRVPSDHELDNVVGLSEG